MSLPQQDLLPRCHPWLLDAAQVSSTHISQQMLLSAGSAAGLKPALKPSICLCTKGYVGRCH